MYNLQGQNGPTGVNNVSLTDRTNAILYLFSPRQFFPQVKRPLVYNFSQSFIGAASEAMVSAVSSNDRRPIDSLLYNPKVLACAMPASDHTTFLDLRPFSDLWTFMLIVDNDRLPNTFGITSTLDNSRVIYYGYCLEEPQNPIAHFGQNSINPNAQMIVTHKTKINRMSSVGAYDTTELVRTTGDVDIVMPNQFELVTNNELYMTRPQDLDQYMATDMEGWSIATIGEQQTIRNTPDPISIDTDLGLPRNNLQDLLVGVANAYDNVSMKEYSGPLYPTLDPILGADTLTSAIQQNLHRPPTITGGLNEGDLITIGSVIARYNPRIQPVTPEPIGFTIADQSQITPNIIFSSLLSSAVPTILANCAMVNFGFIYNSYYDKFEVKVADPLLAISDSERTLRIRTIMTNLKQTIFPMIKERSDFEIEGYFEVGGVSHCIINFLCDMIKNKDFYTVPSILGGFNNSLMGNAHIANNNSLQFNSLMHALCDADRSVPTSLDMERQFQEGLMRHTGYKEPSHSFQQTINETPQQFPWQDPFKR